MMIDVRYFFSPSHPPSLVKLIDKRDLTENALAMACVSCKAKWPKCWQGASLKWLEFRIKIDFLGFIINFLVTGLLFFSHWLANEQLSIPVYFFFQCKECVKDMEFFFLFRCNEAAKNVCTKGSAVVPNSARFQLIIHLLIEWKNAHKNLLPSFWDIHIYSCLEI